MFNIHRHVIKLGNRSTRAFLKAEAGRPRLRSQAPCGWPDFDSIACVGYDDVEDFVHAFNWAFASRNTKHVRALFAQMCWYEQRALRQRATLSMNIKRCLDKFGFDSATASSLVGDYQEVIGVLDRTMNSFSQIHLSVARYLSDLHVLDDFNAGTCLSY